MKTNRYTAEGLPYLKACNMIDALKVVGINANITAGGVAIHCQPQQVNEAKAICDQFGAYFAPGYSMHQESVMLESQDGWKTVARVTGDAAAVAQEWNEAR